MEKLIQRIETDAVDTMLNADIFSEIFGPEHSHWANFYGQFTESVSDAFALAPEGMVDFLIATHHNPPSIYCEIVVRVKKKKASRQETFVAYVSTASQTFQNASARAFSIAALKARAATIA